MLHLFQSSTYQKQHQYTCYGKEKIGRRVVVRVSLPKGSKSQNLMLSEEWATVWVIWEPTLTNSWELEGMKIYWCGSSAKVLAAKYFINRFAYNVEINPDRYSLEKMNQNLLRDTENFLIGRERMFQGSDSLCRKTKLYKRLCVQGPEYYDQIMLLVGATFFDIVKVF